MNFAELFEWLRDWLFNQLGPGRGSAIAFLFVGFTALALSCYLIWVVVRVLLIRVVKNLVTKTKSEWDDKLFEYKVFRSLALIVISLIVNRAIGPLFRDFPSWIEYAVILSRIYIAISVMIAARAIVKALAAQLEQAPSLADKPIRSYKQVATIVVYLITFVAILSILLNESPWIVLGGFGAVTAVFLLLFRDPILGFVASIQMSAIDLVRIGDWITVEKFGADGTVIEINLTTVKVQNFDKTITLVPSYALVSDSFKNWRGMQLSDGRRIKRHINIKIDSIKFCDDKLFNKLVNVERVRSYLEKRKVEIDEYNRTNKVDKSVLINGRHMTNIGIFRIYALNYLIENPDINKDMEFMVRQLEPNADGIPIEIYAFSKKKVWEDYELVMADIFDHLLATVPFFDLEIFQNPSGTDMRELSRREIPEDEA
ncbi:MAG: mechanosensitive ion channel [Flavobacteriales bacterium]|nr:mechanosensitive ion channel [Flavobacteriales bacterium]